MSAHDPALGALRGTFPVVGDSILSHFTGGDGACTGMEYLRFIDGDVYINRGSLISRGDLVSSWSVTLRRV